MENIFKQQHNCWKVKTAERAAFLIDGNAYFLALHEALCQARQSIIIVGWDLHSELRLIREDKDENYPAILGKFLEVLAKKRKELDIYLLTWDFAMIYALEREFFPRYKLKWRTRKQIHFCLDGEHPTGASQHQKIVVIDDAVAFSGGLDLSKHRWDTPDHLPDSTLRIDPAGEPYPPFHDVQMIVDGQVAADLGKLVRQRWQRVCGTWPKETDHTKVGDPWPARVKPDCRKTPIAIARTFPRYKGYDEVREVEKLYLDSIARARSYIYIENQYFSSYRIGEALKKRLRDENCPEIVIVLPLKTGGWLEQHTMDILRNRILHILREADVHDRLRVYYPRLSIDPEVTLMVHAKVMVIDDTFARVGSSNLSNRSLGFDSECDLAIAGPKDSEISEVISTFRNQLLAEHLGVSPQDLAKSIAGGNSFIKTIEALRQSERTLMPLEVTNNQQIEQWIPDSKLLDPEKPLEPEEFLKYFIHPEHQRPAYRHYVKVIITIVIILGLTALWRWTALSDWVNIESVTTVARQIENHPLSPLLVPFSYVLLGIVSFPVTLLIMATIIVYGPWWGSWYALLGTALSAVTMFLFGNMLGKSIVSRISGSLINQINQRLSNRGLLAVITFRIVPVAPFSLINLVAGVSAISLRDFFLGTLIGVLPGITAIAFVADRLAESLRQPDFFSFIALSGVVAASGVGLFLLRKCLKKKNKEGKHREAT
ncbi:MAG: VTT domain-containing protein [Desulforhopalus sp.]